jgi:hypothetical protein
MPKRVIAPQRDRAGAWRVEIDQSGVTRMYILREDGTTEYREQPYSHWMLIAGQEGLTEFAAKRFAKRHPVIDGRQTRAISHEQHLAEVAAEKRKRRSESAKAAWRDRRKRAEKERQKALPPLRAV